MREIISELSTMAKLLKTEDGMGYGKVILESGVLGILVLEDSAISAISCQNNIDEVE
jgi:hypothetical protein